MKYDKEYYEIVKDILNHPEFLRRKSYAHHGKITVYEHSLKVSLLGYKIAKKFKSVDEKTVAIAGLLHDFYDKPWQIDKEKKKFFQKHGFVHAQEALINSDRYFSYLLNEKSRNAILRHMFPLNIRLPKYKESWIITLSDKIISAEVFLHPSFFLYLIKKKERF